MNYSKLLDKQQRYWADKGLIPELTAESFEHAFEISYTHNSTAIEGNTLTLMETKVVLEDGVAVGGKELREIYEQVNHQAAYRYVKKCIAEGKPLDEGIVKDIHQMLMDHILPGGIYRNVNVYISGAQHTPPEPAEMYQQVKVFYFDLLHKGEELNPIELATWTHAEFVRMKNNQPIAVIISPEQYKGYCALAEECHSLLDASVLSLDACSRIQDLLKKIKLFAED